MLNRRLGTGTQGEGTETLTPDDQDDPAIKETTPDSSPRSGRGRPTHHQLIHPPTSRSPSPSSTEQFPMSDEPGTSRNTLKRRVGTLVTGIKDLYEGCFTQESPHKKHLRNRESTFAVEPLRNTLKQLKIKGKHSDRASTHKQITKPPRLTEWLQITCFELEQKVGTSSYKFTGSTVVVDGYTSTSHPDRLCLGAIENHNRNPVVVPVRRQIGAGVELVRGETTITLNVLSDSPIFVQAPLYALSKNEIPSTVFRLSKGETIEIYNEGIFTIELASRIHEKSRVYEMQSMVTCRVSFVKGFGASYRRQSIMHVPCWVELHFQDPLQAIDSELRKMEELGDVVLRSFS